MKKLAITLLTLSFAFLSFSQKPKTYHSGEIQQKLNKLNVLGSVLYLAAHPDDENTRMIAYMANKELMRTAYLSTTRGDGGQNLIGSEIREGLGIIRTQELLAARRIDGGQQFFTRANDFGFSKNTEETLQVWDKEKVLQDYVRIIRTFKPDIIITRFKDLSGSTHGHHSSSATLAKEVYALAADPNAFSDELGDLEPWEVKKLFWNTSWWFYRNTGQKMDTSTFQTIDVGGFDPLLGESYAEIAARSRSQHKSQGFGSIGSRGSAIEFLEQWEGEEHPEVFGGLDLTWDRVEGSSEVKGFLQLAAENYNPANPEETLNALFNARSALLRLPDQFWKEIKLKEIDEVLRGITGMYLEVTADDFSYVVGDTMDLQLEAIARRKSDFKLVEVVLDPWGESQSIHQLLEDNEAVTADFTMVVPEMKSSSHPYWLNESASVGMYQVADPSLIGKPENPPLFTARFIIQWKDQFIEYETPVVYKRRDPVDGEVYRPIVVLPKVTTKVDSDLMIFSGTEAKPLSVRVIASKDQAAGEVIFDVPDGWKVSPATVPFELSIKNEEKVVTVEINPTKDASNGELKVKIRYPDGSESDRGLQIIEYDHIPVQTLLPKSIVRLINVDMKIAAERIGYIMGAGDAIPENLRQVGYSVDLLEKDDVTLENIETYDAIVLGVRAFNTVEWLSYKNEVLFDYVKQGGTMMVQYNTNRSLVTEEVAPYPLTLSRDRVTVEEAPIQIMDAKHPAMNFPNKITNKDFEGWVQERGLYFPSEWDDNFKPLLSSKDPGETAKHGGLLVAPYGKGYYVYTGYSWFRELPAGVTGAYRIYSNLLSLGKQ
jgi:LmbE family N-acetylglucosaminyl deacetylase